MSVLTEASMFPGDYDAFIAMAVPISSQGTSVVPYTLALYVEQRMQRNPSAWLSPSELRRIHEIILRRFDARDGARDGIVGRPDDIHLVRRDFPFLSDAQFEILTLLQRGTQSLAGAGHWTGYGLGYAPGLVGITGETPPPWSTDDALPTIAKLFNTILRSTNGPSFNIVNDMDFTRPTDLSEFERFFRALNWFDYSRTSAFNAFRESHAKLLMWVGSEDGLVSPTQMVDFLADIQSHHPESGSDFARLFVAPGGVHCAGREGGPGTIDVGTHQGTRLFTGLELPLLNAAVSWVERGRVPNFIIAPGQSRTFRWCAYPSRARYFPNRRSNRDNAEDWTCVHDQR